MTSVKNVINTHPVLLFFILVFVISWGAIYAFAGPNGFPITEEQAMIMGMAILLGPSIASILFTGLTSGRTGFRNLASRLFKWRLGFKWYLLSVLTAPLATIAVAGFLSLLSSEFYPNLFLSEEKGGLIIAGVFGGLFVAIFEEIGWTGFAIPRMMRSRNILKTGLVVGILWGAWHFPLFWEVNSFIALLPFFLLMAKLLSWLPPYRILMVWIYRRTESLFVVVLMHLSLVASLMIFDPVVTGEKLLLFILLRAAVLWAIVGVIMYRERRTAG